MSRRTPVGAPGADGNESPSRRLPAFVLAAVLLATALWVRERGDEVVALVPLDRQAAELAPVGADEDAVASTWYCAGGTAGAGGAADHLVVVTNVGGTPVSGRVQAFPVNADPGPPAAFEVPAGGRRALRVGDLVVADHAAALVEMRGGPVFVEHEVRGPTGHDLSRCASRPSSSWYFPWGQTTLGSTLRLALFNPFPGDAVVDVTFDTEDGYRRPEAYQAMLVRSPGLNTTRRSTVPWSTRPSAKYQVEAAAGAPPLTSTATWPSAAVRVCTRSATIRPARASMRVDTRWRRVTTDSTSTTTRRRAGTSRACRFSGER